MGGSGLDWTDEFQKFCGAGLDRIQFLRIKIGLGLKNFTVYSSLMGNAALLLYFSQSWPWVRSSGIDPGSIVGFSFGPGSGVKSF